MSQGLGALVTDVWSEVVERERHDAPDIWRSDVLLEMLGGPRLSYRERLDRQPVNALGRVIPRIVTVRRNLTRLGRPSVAPRLPA